MSIEYRVQSIVEKLQNRHIKPIKIDRGTNLTDPVIWITESVYIQLNLEYVIVFRSRPTGLASYESTGQIDDVVQKLKQAIQEGKEL